MKAIKENREKTWVENEFRDEMKRRKAVEMLTLYDNQDKNDGVKKLYDHFENTVNFGKYQDPTNVGQAIAKKLLDW